jgi:pyruvate/2-oxoglutarate dehydrogenase complex dihydrolipoamide dehydrogenase (E3) component
VILIERDRTGGRRPWEARFADPHTLIVNLTPVEARNVVLASGAF